MRAASVRASRAAVTLALATLLAHATTAHARPSRYEHVLDPADTLAVHGQPQRAVAFVDSVMRSAQERGDRALEAVVASRRVLVWVNIGRFEAAVPEARRVAGLARAERDTLSWCRTLLAEGRAFLFRNRLAEAAPPYQKLLPLAVAVRDPLLEGNARLGLAYLDLNASRMAAAEKGYRRAIGLLVRAGDTRAEMTARVGLARTQVRNGHIEEGKRSYEQIIERCRATGDRLNESDAWNNLGAIESVAGDPARAAECVRRALELSRAAGAPSAMELRNLAILLVESGRAGAAEESLAAEIARRPPSAWRETYVMRNQLALVRGLLGRRAEGERLLRELWAQRDSVPPGDAVDSGVQLVTLISADGRQEEAYALALEVDRWSSAHAETERAGSRALQLAQLEVALGRPADAVRRLDALKARPQTLASMSWRERIGTDVEYSRIWSALGKPDSAVAAAQRAADAWERTASGIRDAEWYEPVGNSGGRVAHQVALALLDPRRPVPAERRAQEAFDAVQRFKSRALDWRTMPGAARPVSLVTAAKLRQVLREGEVFVDAYSSESDSAFVFVVDRSGVGVNRAGMLSADESEIQRPLGVLLSSDPASATFRPAAARRLSALVFGPELPRVRRARRVFASLSGYVNAVPLAALAADTTSDEPLGGTRTIVAVPSASWLARVRASASAVSDPARVVVLARTTDAGGRPLDGVRDEARWLSSRYGGGGLIHPGDRPLADVNPWLLRGDVLHVASHARARQSDSWSSALLLGKGSGEDAWLTARDVARQHPSARLAVLASCRSTLDRGFGNESVLGLARAFLAAGVPTVISTLWPVDDRATADFTRHFYLALEQGAGAAEALRRAQAATRAVPATSAPYYWAGFTVSGDPDTRARPARSR